MEPITTFLIGSAIVGALTTTYGFLINAYGKGLVTLTKDKIISSFRKSFEKKNIVFLGDRGSGKTSLIYYLSNGRPLAENNRPPEPTFGSALLDAEVKTYSKDRKKEISKIVADVSGDSSFRHLWKEIISDTDPHGIIYMLDGRIANEKIEAAVAPIFKDVLSYYTKNSGYRDIESRRLKALHIFVSFSDCWASSISTKAIKESFVTMAFLKRFEEPQYAHLQNLRFSVSTVHLSPAKTEWSEVDTAINRFGADLNDN